MGACQSHNDSLSHKLQSDVRRVSKTTQQRALCKAELDAQGSRIPILVEAVSAQAQFELLVWPHAALREWEPRVREVCCGEPYSFDVQEAGELVFTFAEVLQP